MALDDGLPSRKELRFAVNGKLVVVRDADPRASLGDFLRDNLLLRGLKMPCRQGGCGACTVVISSPRSSDGVLLRHRPVNSCLRTLCSVDGMLVTTVEGIGSCKGGLHRVQQALVKHNGSQCGFCTPGWVMNMYGLLLETPNPLPQQVEDQLDGNLCRCTGYRPILDAFQSLACSSRDGCSAGDIEEVPTCKNLASLRQDDELEISKGGVTWFRVSSLTSLYKVLRNNAVGGVQLVCGNTSSGVYPRQFKSVVVDISCIDEMRRVSIDSRGIRLGGAASLSDMEAVLNSKKEVSSSYRSLLQHVKRIATHQVRNMGTVAGNLMMTYQNLGFVSDVAVLLFAAEAILTIALSDAVRKDLTIEDFFKLPSVDEIVIVEIFLPLLPESVRFLTYKVALRRVNSHALLNAAFRFDVNSSKGLIQSAPVIVYGGVGHFPVRAKNAEAFLWGKSFTDPQVCDSALEILQKEIVMDPSYGNTSYRTSLVAAYFYKAILSLWPKDRVPSTLQSSISEFSWPITSGTKSFDKGDPSQYPVSKPLPKLSAMSQASGELKYVNDFNFGNELYATYVISTVGNAKIKGIDPARALAENGVVTFISAATLAGAGYNNKVNEFEEVFAASDILYCGQAVGLVVAKSKRVADYAATLVDVQYMDIKKPIITIEDAVSANSFFHNKDRELEFQQGSVTEAFSDSEAILIEGQVSVGNQYHFHLETQQAVCVPSEDGFIEVYSSTQNPSKVQSCVSAGLNRPQHKITVSVKRIGGAYGAKINRSSLIAMACAFAADLLKRPVRLVLDLSTNMQLVGGRSPYFCKYKISARKTGQITGVKMDIINNHGAHFDFGYPTGSTLPNFIDGAYKIPNWDLKTKIARTNTPACTYMRGPVFVETTTMIETALDHVAFTLRLARDQVREINMYEKGDVSLNGQRLNYCNAKLVFDAIKESSNYLIRSKQVDEYNSSNLWRKRGISIVPVKFIAEWHGAQHLALINVHPDGSISIHHSGCEMGQGLDVKVAQVAAMTLGSLQVDVSMEDIAVHTTTTTVANNVAESGGSVASELCAKAVHDGCTQLVERLRAVKTMLVSGSKSCSWKDLISAAVSSGVDLQARGRVYPAAAEDGPSQYTSFGAGVTEVEVDILTGETFVIRADVLLDCGKSLNPAVDIGQVQGAFIQGLGYFLTEEFHYDPSTGKLLTDGTWEYKPPFARDIPYEFNTALLPNSENPSGFLRSKFSGEPPYGTACSALLAVSQALAAARSQWNGGNGWSPLSSPATPQNVALAAEFPLSSVSFRELFSMNK
ncbi:xanthine dehydrogenase/oxidase isoform X2 [Selaginella moellendorffii]|uniref:xanthine dehydrogenase/oxidase isoform X2 n=1 Tax=Selaginella moellendorffii TaxID=88036 RepID=UPI000D1CF46C|nr:xanthine dehydrogenase/oxidase isoform X2 [Selaginella moellendorffii]|eukprot:XP_024541348.1 xanthine dehydrogenase/oxidase isoform X2 [Selaginella moellendorffii]